MRVNSTAALLPPDVSHDRVSAWLEREIKNLHGVLRKRHRTNFIGRGILDRIVETCLEEVWATDVASAFDPPLEDFESRWAAALIISESAKQLRLELGPYSKNYVKSARWYLKPWVVVESAICIRAIRYLLDDVAQLYEELRSKGDFQVRG